MENTGTGGVQEPGAGHPASHIWLMDLICISVMNIDSLNLNLNTEPINCTYSIIIRCLKSTSFEKNIFFTLVIEIHEKHVETIRLYKNTVLTFIPVCILRRCLLGTVSAELVTVITFQPLLIL